MEHDSFNATRPAFRAGDRVTFRLGGEDLIMTVARVTPEHEHVEIEYRHEGQLRRLGIVARALKLADNEDRAEGGPCR